MRAPQPGQPRRAGAGKVAGVPNLLASDTERPRPNSWPDLACRIHLGSICCRIEQIGQFRWIRRLDLEHPAVSVGLGVHQLGRTVERVIAGRYRAAHGRVDVAHALRRLKLAAWIARADLRADLGQRHEDDVSELFLGVIGDSDTDAAVDILAGADPLVLGGVFQVLGIHRPYSHLPTRSDRPVSLTALGAGGP